MNFVACFITNQNKILTLKRAAGEIEGGKFGLVGGMVEENEDILDAIVREIKEEVGLSVKSEELIPLEEFPIPYKNLMIDFSAFKLVVDSQFIPTLDPEEAEDFEWVTIEELLNKKDLAKSLDDIVKLSKFEESMKS